MDLVVVFFSSLASSFTMPATLPFQKAFLILFERFAHKQIRYFHVTHVNVNIGK